MSLEDSIKACSTQIRKVTIKYYKILNSKEYNSGEINAEIKVNILKKNVQRLYAEKEKLQSKLI